MKITFVIAAILCFRVATAQAQDKGGCQGMDGKLVYIIADNGALLTRCNKCGPSVNYEDSVSLHGQRGRPEAMWTLETVRIPELNEDLCALKADNGLYAAVDQNGWGTAAIEFPVFVYARTKSTAPWNMKRHAGGKTSFKSHSGQKYLARCRDCVKGGATKDFAFTHVYTPESVALWTVEYVDPTDAKQLIAKR